MSIITTSYFTANLDLPGRIQTGTGENLQLYIDRYEPIFLRGVLGNEIYTLLKAAYDAFVDQPPVALPQRWADLLNGVEYDVSDITYRWQGLRQTSLLLSPIANYVYYQYRKDTETRTGNTGENKPKAQNADSISPINKLVWAWNDMVDVVGNVYNLALPQTLYHFLENNTDTYPEWIDTHIDSQFFTKVNAFGI